MQQGEFRETLKETDWAWLAGFLDGEGHLSIRRGYAKRPERGRHKAYKYGTPQDGWEWYSPRILVNGTHLPSMEKAAGMLQGNIHTRKAQPHSVLKLYGAGTSARKTLANILPKLIPYLVVKRAEAELINEFVGLPRGSGPEKKALFQRMEILSQARPGTEPY